jgi:hypothetical protein
MMGAYYRHFYGQPYTKPLRYGLGCSSCRGGIGCAGCAGRLGQSDFVPGGGGVMLPSGETLQQFAAGAGQPMQTSVTVSGNQISPGVLAVAGLGILLLVGASRRRGER